MPERNQEDVKALLGQTLAVHNHGFVRLVDAMGDDAAIVQAARISYGPGTKSRRSDRLLIRYLMRHRHTTPFEMVELKFHIKAPIFVARQLMRHRTASINEVSGRYSEMREEFYLPTLDAVKPQSTTNRQGRAEDPFPADQAAQVIEEWTSSQAETYALYRRHLDQGLSREIARISLPNALYTEWYWKVNLHNCFHFLSLRLDPHAQEEIRAYAEEVARCTRAVAPVAYEAFEEYVLGAVTFSRSEMDLLRKLLRSEKLCPEDLDHSRTWRQEFEARLGTALPEVE
ncbi:MAG TPA: FAD-dependent thymidylate synthase [Chloroflexota bacterium]|jgi:thymidylate synthase (FAD)|nr:FAD-dependent thymidylate synthase [Chloroflexota bacterium]